MAGVPFENPKPMLDSQDRGIAPNWIYRPDQLILTNRGVKKRVFVGIYVVDPRLHNFFSQINLLPVQPINLPSNEISMSDLI